MVSPLPFILLQRSLVIVDFDLKNPRSRVEKSLAYITGYSDVPPDEPRSRVEAYLKMLADNGGIGGSGVNPDDVERIIRDYIDENNIGFTIDENGILSL